MKINIISKKENSFVLAIKDGRYSIDKELAEAIEIF